MLSTFQIRLVVLIATLGHVVDNSPSYRNSPGSEIRCKWNCFVHMADLTMLKREMANSTTANNKLIKLSVQYEKLIDDKCTNKMSVNSSESSFEHCQVCLVNKLLSNSMTSNKSAINTFLRKEHREIRAICTLKPVSTIVSSPMDYSNRSSAICHLINLEHEFESIDYHAVETDPHGLCMNFTIPDRTNSTKRLQGALDLRRWPKMVLDFFSKVFQLVFAYYSLAFLCLLYPTEILQDGVTHIIIEGASPVSLRSFAGNYFFSGKEGIWCKAKTFILRVVIIPLPFIVIATVFADFEVNTLSTILCIAIGFLYCFHAFYVSFFSKRSSIAKSCYICDHFKPEILSRHDNLPQFITYHLRLQALILAEYWRIGKSNILNYFKMSVTVIPSYRCSKDFAIRLVLFISLLPCIPVFAALLFFWVGCLTSPVTSLFMYQFIPRLPPNSKMSMLLFIFTISWIGVIVLLILGARGARNVLVRVFLLSLSEEHLPYVACFVSVLYYIWSSYSSFTETYHELALTLYDCHKDSKRTQFRDVPSTSDQLPELPNNTRDLDNVMAIPKELFGMACEELLPLREGVYKLILKITMIVSTVFTVFLWVTASSFDTTPLMKTLLAFFTFAFPKIVDMYIDGEWQKKMRERVMKEKVSKIVDKFINETSMTTQAQRDRIVSNGFETEL